MKKELAVLKNIMKERGLDAYIIKVSDRHGSESVAAPFRFLEYICGFTGSRGLLVVTCAGAGLWTDSRYFIQAGVELAGSGVDLYKERMPETISPKEFLEKMFKENSASSTNQENIKTPVIGIDGKTFSYGEIAGLHLNEIGEVRSEDLAAAIWEDRPVVNPQNVRLFNGAGDGAISKIEKIRGAMKIRGATYHIISTLDDIAWTLNLRGSDIPYVPVFYSYLVIGMDKVWIFAYEEAFQKDVKDYLEKAGVSLMPYDDFYEKLPDIIATKGVMINPGNTSFELFSLISRCANIIQAPEPSILLKAQKDALEIDRLRFANILDGVAMCKFLYWIKSSPLETEISAAKKLREIRLSLGASDESFETITAYEEHGAIVHYTANTKTNAKLLPKGFLLVDSGAHYEGPKAFGTTDITRTIALGPLTDEMKLSYSLVLMGHIDYMMAHFPKGTSLSEIDVLAHSHLRARGLDYYHGTSHGIGYALSVHEALGSAGIRSLIKPGMIMSDEPGVYIEGKFGIRIEGDLLCKEENDFLSFEMLTLCPYEREAIITSMLSPEQVKWINLYHAKLRNLLLPYLEGAEKDWLYKATEKI